MLIVLNYLYKIKSNIIILLIFSTMIFSIKTNETIASYYPSVSAQVGTLGIGINIAQPVSKYFNFRFNLNGFNANYSNKIKSINYNANMHWFNYGLLLDYHPFSNGFYLTGGEYYNGNNIKLKSKLEANKDITIGGQTFNSNDLGSNGLNGKISFNKFKPYLGLGYASNTTTAKGFTFIGEFGVLFTGAIKLNYNVDCNLKNDSYEVCNQLKSATDKEKSNIDKDLQKIKVYPVLYLGIGYKF
ncbi:hypothetical protein ACFX5K_00005 [Rickettsiales bacterium LUAb2]